MEKKKQKTIILIACIAVAVLLAIAITIIVVINVKNNKSYAPVTTQDVTYVEFPDVDKYFEENSDVKSIVSVNEAENNLTETDVLTRLEQRGFSDITLKTQYDMDGSYYESREVSENSEKHPIYTGMYTAKSGEIWNITITADQITATPISYIYQSESDQSVIVSESDTIISYDSQGGRYFMTVPHEEFMKVIVVDTVDAQTLDQLSAKEIEAS